MGTAESPEVMYSYGLPLLFWHAQFNQPHLFTLPFTLLPGQAQLFVILTVPHPPLTQLPPCTQEVESRGILVR